MAVDPQHPVDFRRNLLFEIEQRGRELVELGAAFGTQNGLAGIEEHLRLEDKAVADDADVRTIAENVAQPAEEIRAVARQFLNALRQRDVQALAEVGDVQLRVFFLLLGDVERALRARRSGGATRDLLVENFDLRDGARGRRLLEYRSAN